MDALEQEYFISTDKKYIDIALVHNYLSNESYWSEGIPLETVQKSIEHSLCFGIYRKDGGQAGFARVISDLATYAYLADVFVITPERGKGLSKWLMRTIIDHPDLQWLRRFVLATKDAHSLYAQFGFEAYSNPERLMGRHSPNLYKGKQ